MAGEASRSAAVAERMPVASRSRQRGTDRDGSAASASAAGNLAIGRLLALHGIQAKLTVSQPGDPEEEEADRVANAVVSRSAVPTIQRACAACSSGGATCPKCEEEERVKAKRSASGVPSANAVAHALAVVSGGGSPLPGQTRSILEPGFGRDLSRVRVHADSAAADAAHGISARAYTVGEHIAFAPGEYRPDHLDGQRLLAHEVAHTFQQGARGAGLFRDGKPGGEEKKEEKKEDKKREKKKFPTTGETVTFIGHELTENPDQLREEMLDIVENGVKGKPIPPGLIAPDQFLNLIYLSPPSFGCAENDESCHRRQILQTKIAPKLSTVVRELYLKHTDQLAKFEDVMKQNALQTLAASKLQTEAEKLRYGIHTDKVTTTYPVRDTERTRTTITHRVDDIQSPAIKGLRAAAGLLLARRKAVREKHLEADRHMACRMGACGTDKEYDRIAAEALQLRKEYIGLHQVLSFQYPVLDRIGAIEETRSFGEDAIWASNELEKLASGGSEAEVASTLGAKIQETLDKNATAREGVEQNRVNLWRLQHIYGVSKKQAAIDDDPILKILVEERWRNRQPNIIDAILEGIALLLLNVAAIALAAPTGGASLVVAFGVNAGLAVKHTMDYVLDKAVAGSDLSRAQSLSQDDPSFLWLAIEIIGVGLDGAMAVHALKTMKPVVKAAQVAAKDAEITSDALKSIEDAAKSVGKPELAKNVAGKLPKGNAAVLESVAPAGKAEIQTFAGATRAIEEEATKGFGAAVKSAAGGEINVSKAGHIWSCASPCTVLREKYAQIFASDDKLLNRLTDLEKRAAAATKAREAATEAKAIADAEKELQQIKQLAGELEGAADDIARTLKNPQAAEALKNIAASTAHTVPSPALAGKIAGLRAKLLPKFPLIDRLSGGAIERIARAAMAQAEGGGLRRALRGLAAARGQLLEEISAARIRTLLETPKGREALGLAHLGELGEKAIFIEGSRIRDAGGAMLTDGIIAIQRGDRLEIVAVLESKAGSFAAGGLTESLGGLKRASTSEIIEAIFAASGNRSDRGVMASIAKANPKLHNVLDTTRGANLAANEALFRENREALMAALEGLSEAELKAVRKGLQGGEGQVSRDIERLMTSGNRQVDLTIDGQPVTGWSPKRPQFLGAVPSDVKTADIAAELAKQKFDFKALDMGADAASKTQLDQLAKAIVDNLEAEMIQASKAVPK